MNFEGIFDLINELLEDISTIDKSEHKKSFRRRIDKGRIKELVEKSIENKNTNSTENFEKESDDYQIILSEYKFERHLEDALREVSKRNNQVWKYKKAKMLLFKSYFSVMEEVFMRSDLNADKILKYRKPYRLSANILDSLMVIAEEKLRSEFTIFADIDVDKHISFLKENDLADLLGFFKKKLDEFYLNLGQESKDEIYEEFLLENPNKVNDIARYIENSNLIKQIDLANKFIIDEKIGKLKKALSKSDFNFTSMLGFSYLVKDNEMTKADENMLFKLILKENYPKFISLVNENNLSIELIDRLLDLDKKEAKKITIDKDKVKISRKELSSTVKKVSEFMDSGEDLSQSVDNKTEEKEEETTTKNSDSIKLDDETYSFLETIIKNNGISLEEAKIIALKSGQMVNVFVNEINDTLYPFVDDQSLLIEDDRVVIDPFYIDIVKEILDEN